MAVNRINREPQGGLQVSPMGRRFGLKKSEVRTAPAAQTPQVEKVLRDGIPVMPTAVELDPNAERALAVKDEFIIRNKVVVLRPDCNTRSDERVGEDDPKLKVRKPTLRAHKQLALETAEDGAASDEWGNVGRKRMDYDYDMAEAELEYERLELEDALEAGVYYADEIDVRANEIDIYNAEEEKRRIGPALKRLDEGTFVEGEEMTHVPEADQEVPDALNVLARQSRDSLAAAGQTKIWERDLRKSGAHITTAEQDSVEDPDNQAPDVTVEWLEENATPKILASVVRGTVAVAEVAGPICNSAVVYVDRKPLPTTTQELWVNGVKVAGDEIGIDYVRATQALNDVRLDSMADAIHTADEAQAQVTESYGLSN